MYNFYSTSIRKYVLYSYSVLSVLLLLADRLAFKRATLILFYLFLNEVAYLCN